MTTKEFLEQAKKNDWEVYTPDQVASFIKDEVFNKSLSEEDRKVAAVEYSSLKKEEVINEDMTKSIFYYRESQVEWDKAEDGSLMKSRSGVYKDTSINRRLNRVGQKYNSKKREGSEEEKKTSSSVSEQAAAASDKQLQEAMKDENASKETKEAAQKELENRQATSKEEQNK